MPLKRRSSFGAEEFPTSTCQTSPELNQTFIILKGQMCPINFRNNKIGKLTYTNGYNAAQRKTQATQNIKIPADLFKVNNNSVSVNMKGQVKRVAV